MFSDHQQMIGSHFDDLSNLDNWTTVIEESEILPSCSTERWVLFRYRRWFHWATARLQKAVFSE